eukprot:TRINITY_DN12837_c0_g3_i5.p5 TRINITY_DN12837_c0_g3~~TRINITY_DN12837_c0_g3_i5.p5  ORF type:complete len:110 (+),score=13.78 TRINITY_DN12837_c0_g3_i5:111-440(+)
MKHWGKVTRELAAIEPIRMFTGRAFANFFKQQLLPESGFLFPIEIYFFFRKGGSQNEFFNLVYGSFYKVFNGTVIKELNIINVQKVVKDNIICKLLQQDNKISLCILEI